MTRDSSHEGGSGAFSPPPGTSSSWVSLFLADFISSPNTGRIFRLVLPWLPWLLLLACPAMHLFMHHGNHGGHNHTSMPAPGPEDKP